MVRRRSTFESVRGLLVWLAGPRPAIVSMGPGLAPTRCDHIEDDLARRGNGKHNRTKRPNSSPDPRIERQRAPRKQPVGTVCAEQSNHRDERRRASHRNEFRRVSGMVKRSDSGLAMAQPCCHYQRRGGGGPAFGEPPQSPGSLAAESAWRHGVVRPEASAIRCERQP